MARSRSHGEAVPARAGRRNATTGLAARLVALAAIVVLVLMVAATAAGADRGPGRDFCRFFPSFPGCDTTTTDPATTTAPTTTATTQPPTTPPTTQPRHFPPPRPPVTTRPVATTQPVVTSPSGTVGGTPAAPQPVQEFGATSPSTSKSSAKAKGNSSSSSTTTPKHSSTTKGSSATGSRAAADPAKPPASDPLVRVAGRSVDRKAQLPVQLIANSDEGDDTGQYVAVGVGVALLLAVGGAFVWRGSRRAA